MFFFKLFTMTQGHKGGSDREKYTSTFGNMATAVY